MTEQLTRAKTSRLRGFLHEKTYPHPTLKTYNFKNNGKPYKSVDMALKKCTFFHSDGNNCNVGAAESYR
ncbi:MAG: hypothetical protein NTY50_09850 [Methylobacter sp.]|nr:hypothetical protein [Methylobacter sp.]